MFLSQRPQFTTRDPFPCLSLDGRYRVSVEDDPGFGYYWWPRHKEFDTPVNPILAEFRRNGGNSVLYIGLDRWPTPEEIKFAQRVLHLRATLSN